MTTHVDPRLMSNPAIPTEHAAAAAWWQNIADHAVTEAMRVQAQHCADFWRSLIKEAQPAPLTNEQRRARREKKER